MGRIPEEPVFDEAEKIPPAAAARASNDGGDGDRTGISMPSAQGVSWPNAFNCNEVKSCKSAKEYAAICLDHIEDLSRAGLRLTDAELTPMEPLTRINHEGSAPIRVETAPVAGVPYDDLKCVRHTAEFDANAEIVFDAYVRLNYTNAIDRYAYHVEMLEQIETGGRFRWAHFEYTADRIMPFFAHRDFVTLDFVDGENLMLVSRSCLHPRKPQTAVPTLFDCLHGIVSSRPTRTLRSPLCYVCRVMPLGEVKCQIVQFQYSDMGGIIPPLSHTNAVVKFGLLNLEGFYRIMRTIQKEGLEVGPDTADYLANPLSSGWNRHVGDQIPGL